MSDLSFEKGLVSIIMPTYNCEEFIGFTIDSVINQTYTKWEIIIVDDASTDGTTQKINKFITNDTRIKYFKLDENSGAAIARNKAIDLAKGEFIAFLDSDDLWLPTKLEKQIKYMRDHNYNFTCTSYSKIDENGNSLGRTIQAKGRSDYNDILKTCPGNSTVIYNAKVLGKFKIPDIKKRNDYVMWLQVIKKEKYLIGIEETLGNHRIRRGAISSKKTNLVGYHWKVYREIENLSFTKSIYLIFFWVFATVFKRR